MLKCMLMHTACEGVLGASSPRKIDPKCSENTSEDILGPNMFALPWSYVRSLAGKILI